MRFFWPQTQTRRVASPTPSFDVTFADTCPGAGQGAQLELDCVFTLRLSLGLTHAARACSSLKPPLLYPPLPSPPLFLSLCVCHPPACMACLCNETNLKYFTRRSTNPTHTVCVITSLSC